MIEKILNIKIAHAKYIFSIPKSTPLFVNKIENMGNAGEINNIFDNFNIKTLSFASNNFSRLEIKKDA